MKPKERSKYMIKDWAGNVLNRRGKFDRTQFAVPKEFASFEDGWSWILENIEDEETHQDLYVEEIGDES